MAETPQVSQLAVLSAQTDLQKTQESFLAVLVASGTPPVRQVRVSQGVVLAAVQGSENTQARVSEVKLLAATKTGIPDRVRQRAWTFDLDGHTFYVLDLYEEGTWVFDLATGQWAPWETEGFGTWNMLNGYQWEAAGKTVAGDSVDTVIWELDPHSHLDEAWRPIRHRVTGLFPYRGKAGLRIDAARLSASMGRVGDTYENPTITMRFSDTNGETWSPAYPVELRAGDYAQMIEWLSLGMTKTPGRVFEIASMGGLIRLDGFDVEPEGQG